MAVSLSRVDDSLAVEWDELAVAAGASPFLRPGWVTAWSEAFDAGPLQAVVARRAGRLVALLPVVGRSRRGGGPPASLRSAPTSETARSGLVCSDADAAAELVAGLPPAVTRLSLEFVAADDPLAAAVRPAAPAGFITCQRVLRSSLWLPTGAGTYEDYEKGRVSGSRRSTWRRRERRLAELGALDFTVEDGRAGLDRALEEGFAVEAAGWKGAQGTAVLSRPAARAFYWKAARWAAAEGILQLGFVRLDGRAIAFSFGLQADGVVAVPKAGYDPAYAAYGPGVLLNRRLIRRSFEDPTVFRYEFLGEAEEYKRVFTDHAEPQLRIDLLRDGPAGRLRCAATTAGWRARGELARRVPLEVRVRMDLKSPAGVARAAATLLCAGAGRGCTPTAP